MSDKVILSEVPFGRASHAVLVRQLEVQGWPSDGCAPSTQRAYRADLADFVAWCAQQGLPFLPAAPTTVASYLRDQIVGNEPKRRDPASPATVRRRVAAIARFHRDAKADNPCATPEVRDTLKKDGRERGTDQKQARALTKREADKIKAAIVNDLDGDANHLRDLRDLAVVLVGRDLLARASELTSITVEAITWQADGTAQVSLRRRKTTSKVVRYPLGRDAVAALNRWLTASGVRTGPIFHALTSGGRLKDAAITPRDVSRIVAARAGHGFSSHSLRVGMACDLTAANFELAAIMQAGGWKSAEMVARYTQHLTAACGAVARYHAQRAEALRARSQGITDGSQRGSKDVS